MNSEPARPPRDLRANALLLFPGAGSHRDHSALVAIEHELGARSPEVGVVRADFPYRKAGRRAPDRAPVLLAAVREEAAAIADTAGLDSARIALGGRSMGGRMCSMAVADGLPAAALVLISYPLHPPGKPEQLRTAHFPQLDLPCLFVHGDRDPFGTPGELTEAVTAIPGPVTHLWIERGRHDLAGQDAAVASAVADWLWSLDT